MSQWASRRVAPVLLLYALASWGSPGAPEQRSVAQLQSMLDRGTATSESLTKAYLARLRHLNPQLHAVIAVNPRAMDEARRSDQRRAHGSPLSGLDGIPILLKDNIDVVGQPTTAGSLALAQNLPLQDAALVGRLKKAGMVVLGKTNLSEWANIRSNHSISGWSAIGGLTRNPYARERSACGSSSGSAVAVAVDMAPLAVGTETDGSVTCPAAMNGLVGLKPTVGLISRAGVVPISASQDTAGPMARSVEDAALLLELLAGTDAADPATTSADSHRSAYARGLDRNALRGTRIGVLRFLRGYTPTTLDVFAAALHALQAQGAVLVDVDEFDFADMGAQELTILLTEFKVGVNAYLAATPKSVTVRSLDALLDFDRSEARELALFDQDLFESAARTAGSDSPDYVAARQSARERAGPNGIDRLLREKGVVALIAPTTSPAWTIDEINGDPGGGGSAGKLAAVSGYPHLTVPMGNVQGLPVGLSFMGPAWSEQLLLSLGYAFESAAAARRPPPRARVARARVARVAAP
jgi:amidase